MNFMAIILVGFNGITICMDEPNLWNKFRQQYVTLHLSDGNDFKIETWKIFESVALYRDYIRRQHSSSPVKNMSLLYSDVTLPEAQLYSDACQVEEESFDRYFKQLDVNARRRLITVCGKYDEYKQHKKLHCPGLIGSLLKAYYVASHFKNDVTEQLINTNIRPHIYHRKLRSCIGVQMVKKKLPHYFASTVQYTPIFSCTDDGCIQKIPSILAKGYYYSPNAYKQNSYKGKNYLLYRAKILSKDSAYHLTSIEKNDMVEMFLDSLLLWFVDYSKDIYSATELKHAGEIIDARFDKDANHLFIQSPQMVRLFKLMHKNDAPILQELMTFNTAENSHACNFNFGFNKQGTIFLASYIDSTTQKNVCTLWDIVGENCSLKLHHKSETLPYLVWSDNGCRLIIVSYPSSNDDKSNTIALWDIDDASNFSLINHYRDYQEDFITESPIVACIKWSPDGKRWLIVYSNANIFFFDESSTGYPVKRKLPARKTIIGVSLAPEHKVRAHYSPDGCFVAISYVVIPGGVDHIALYSATTYEYLGITGYLMDGFGITPDNQLIMMGKYDIFCPFYTKISLLSQENNNELDYIQLKSPLFALSILWRLRSALKKNERISLYKEGLAYRIIQRLLRLNDVIEECFPIIDVINNNREVAETCESIAAAGKAEWMKGIDGLQQWWKNV